MNKFLAGLAMLRAAAWLALTQMLTLLMQFTGLVLGGVLFYLLLLVPDSHAWTVAISGLGWPTFILTALWIQVLIFRRMRGEPQHPLLKYAIPTLLLWVVAWFFLWRWVLHISENFPLYASYLNSRLPAQGRTVLTFERIFGLFDDAYIFVQWWLLPALFLPAAIETTAGRLNSGTFRRIVRVWFAWPLWLSLVLIRWIGGIYTRHLLGWHPKHTATMELVSVFSRTAFLILLDVLLWYFVIAIICAYLRKSAATADGTPEESQPLTAEKP